MDYNKILSFKAGISSVISIFLVILFGIGFVLNIISNDFILILYITIILINFFLLLLYRNNTPLLLFFVFCFFYTLSLVPYFFYKIDVSPWPDFNELGYYNKIVVIYGLFLIVPIIYTRNVSKVILEDIKLPLQKNSFFFILFYIICFSIVLFGQSGSNLFESGAYASTDSSKSVLFEYFVLFFLLSYYYSSRSKKQLFLLFFLALFYTGKSLMYGGRIEVVQIFLMLFYLFLIESKIKIKPFKLILFCLVFYYMNLIVANIRSNPLKLIEGDYSSLLLPFNYDASNIKYISSNEGDVMQSSARMVGLVDTGQLNWLGRIKSLLGFIFSIVLPSSWLPSEASLITFKKDIYPSGGGGLMPVYFYCFLGWGGPMFISFYILKIVNKIKIDTSIYFKLYVLMAFSTFPRWFAYNPIILFKLCLWIIPIAFVCNTIHAIIINKTKILERGENTA